MISFRWFVAALLAAFAGTAAALAMGVVMLTSDDSIGVWPAMSPLDYPQECDDVHYGPK